MADEPGSIRSIAESLIVKPDEERKPKREPAALPDTDARPIEADAADDETDGGQRPLPSDDDGQEPGSDGGQEADAGSDDDEPWYRVKVDGQDREVSLSDLLRSYTGEGAIAKRLQEATEARAQAVRARDAAIEQERHAARETIQYETETLRTQASQLAAVYQTYAGAILQPEVQMPDPNLRQTDPMRYLVEVEAYRSDQDRLRQQAAHMQEVIVEADRLERERITEFAHGQVQQMMVEVPAMANPAYRRAQAQRVVEVGKAVGFTEEEVRRYATDRRVIYLAMLAAKGAEDMIKVRSGGKPRVEVKAPAPKATAVVRSQNGRFKGNAKAIEVARKTGSVEDVAKTMIVSGRPAKKSGNGNFRARVL